MSFSILPLDSGFHDAAAGGEFPLPAVPSRPVYGPAYRVPPQSQSAARWLCNTDLLQHDHPRIRLLALKLTQLKPGARAKAVACHDFVWRMPFACSGDVLPRSNEVLQSGAGDGFAKTTLFIALLRSIDIPARARVVALEPGCMRGLQQTSATLVEHMFAEVLLDGWWLGVDTYVVDPALGFAARSRLVEEGLQRGWSVHLRGQTGWAGYCSSFGQFSTTDPQGLPVLDLGAFDDAQQFRASGAQRYGGAPKSHWGIGPALVNRRIRKLREGAIVGYCAARDPNHRSSIARSSSGSIGFVR